MKQAFTNFGGELSTANTQYMSPTSGDWIDASSVASISEAGQRMPIAGAFGRLYIQRWHPSNGSTRQVGVGITETLTLYVNGIASSCTVSMSGTDVAGSHTTGYPATFSINDTVTLVRTTSGGTPNNCRYTISFIFRGTVAMRSLYGGNFISSSTGTRYITPLCPRISGGIPSSRATVFGSSIVGGTGNLGFHTIQVTTAPGAGKSWTFTLYKDGVSIPGSAVTIANAATTGSATFSIPCTEPPPLSTDPAVFPEVSLEITPSGTPASTRVKYGCWYDSTSFDDITSTGAEMNADNNVSLLVFNPGSLAGSGSDTYTPSFNWGTVEAASEGEWADADGVHFGVVLAKFAVKIPTAPGGSATRRFTFRYYHEADAIFKDAAEGAQAALIGFGGTAASQPKVANGVQTVGYPGAIVGQTNRRFIIRQDVTSIPNAADYCWLGGQMYVGSFGHTVIAFDGTVTGISPNEGPVAGGTGFTITGTGFQGTAGGGAATITGASVVLNGITATSVSIVNNTTITGTSGVAVTPGTGNVVITFATNGSEGEVATATITNGWTYTGSGIWWKCDDPPNCAMPSAGGIGIDGIPIEGPIWVFQDTSPGAGWVQDVAPQPHGWWISREGMAGGPLIADGTRVPKGPRTLAEVSVFATGAAAHLQGNCAVVFRNKLIYAARGYTVDTDDPPLRIYDGLSDRFLIGVPKDASLAPAEAVISMLVANGTIYIATLDNNAGGGRVLQFDLDSLTFTPIGAAFGSGDVSYAMCWHMGRLWVGTNDGDGTAQNVYFIRPGIDSAWTTDEAMSAHTLGGVCSMASYKGKLYVGTDNVSTANGKILVRDETGVYTVSETGTGTSAMNGYIAMVVFQGNLYAAYWNSSGSVSRIRKFDNSSWSTVYTGASGTAVPILALFEHDDFLYALFGTATTSAQLIRSDSGTSYTDLTTFLTPSTIRATPAYGSLRF